MGFTLNSLQNYNKILINNSDLSTANIQISYDIKEQYNGNDDS